jgi:hypothetical protein
MMLSLIWWLGGLLAWFAVRGHAEPVSVDGRLITTAIFVLLISGSLRLPTITSTAATGDAADHWVWLLCFAANVNWLGMILLKAASLWCVTAILLLWIIGEFSLGYLAWRGRRLSRFFSAAKRLISTPSLFGSPAVSELSSRVAPSPVGQPADNRSETGTDVSCSKIGGTEERLRQTVHDGFDSDGRRYLAGTTFLSWQPEQRTQIVIIGIVPAFDSVPEFDSETDQPNLTVRIINCTPAGLRLSIKRAEPLDSNTSQLDWFVRESPCPEVLEEYLVQKPPLP